MLFSEKMDANPWLVENIQTFSFLNCPECTFKSKGAVISEIFIVWSYPKPNVKNHLP